MGVDAHPLRGQDGFGPWPREARMDKFLHRHNLENFRKQLAEAKDDAQRQTLLKLLAEEEAKREPRPHRPPRERLIFRRAPARACCRCPQEKAPPWAGLECSNSVGIVNPTGAKASHQNVLITAGHPGVHVCSRLWARIAAFVISCCFTVRSPRGRVRPKPSADLGSLFRALRMGRLSFMRARPSDRGLGPCMANPVPLRFHGVTHPMLQARRAS